jgi:hypothetical protein
MVHEAADTLFGYPLPFPRQDLYVALIAVSSFIPAVVIINAVVNALITIVSLPFKKQKAQ